MLPTVSEEEAAAPEEDGFAVLGQEDEGGRVGDVESGDELARARAALEA